MGQSVSDSRVVGHVVRPGAARPASGGAGYRLRSIFGFRKRFKETKKMIHPCDLQYAVNALAYAHQSKSMTFFLVCYISAHHSTDARRIDVRHFGEIDDESAGIVGADSGLEIEQCCYGQWST